MFTHMILEVGTTTEFNHTEVQPLNGCHLKSPVTSGDLPQPGSCCILFAGTNDVAADESDNILEHLERKLTARLSSSAVIVSTVPHRHDLPEDHPVNQRIDLVNFYIEELSIRHEGVELLNFNLIGRRWFTRHGMHLRLPGKRLLADLVLESLHRCARLFAARLPASPAAAAPACASHSSPPCLPAAALDSTSSTQPPFTAPGPHPVGAYSETAAQELTTNGIVNSPTRVSGATSTAIDNVVTNISQVRVSVLDAAISDHRAQVVEVIGCSPDVEGQAPKILRVTRQQNIKRLRSFLGDESWIFLDHFRDANGMFNAFNERFLFYLNSSCPFKKSKRFQNFKKISWITQGIQISRDKIKFYHSIYICTENENFKVFSEITEECIKE
ncbi:hypothetical protein J6590_090852 [Homalodisca vitripennis]|nr:hypothetical protein J6590_090852 [Homalodisca vitripennis]